MVLSTKDAAKDFSSYKAAVEGLAIGKRLPDAVYVHQSALSSIPDVLAKLADEIAGDLDDDWDVIKFFRRDFRVSFLSYPAFFDESYPQLAASRTVDLVRGTSRLVSYTGSKNPPILHRKETLIDREHPAYEKFRAITQEGEAAGLYDSTGRIGFRDNWNRLIAQKGFQLVDGRLVRANREEDDQPSLGTVEIARHRTAIDRDQLSAPMNFLARAGYFDGNYSVFDYGCGKGHDIVELEAHGIDVGGWDPAHRPDAEKCPADIVNLGFVINVIEDRPERESVLQEAFALANKLLVVSVMLGGEATVRKFKPYKDGVVTSRNTFQKYYTQSELKHFIESTLAEKAVAVSPGVFGVFKDELEEQNFLVKRQRVQRQWRQLTLRDRASPPVDFQSVIEGNNELFQDFWASCLDFGRIPANDEFDRTQEVRRAIGSHRKAFEACSEYFSADEFEKAREGRIEDITTFLALSFFDRREAYRRMPLSLQRDIKAFFSKPSIAYEVAKLALFSVADTKKITLAAFEAREKLGYGRLESDHSLVVHSSLVPRLPGILRIFVGCAMQLYGDLDGVDLVKIHMTSGKVSLMIYDDFESPLPLLQTRVKIRLRDQEIDWFYYDGEYQPQPLYLKSQYIAESDASYQPQVEFDRSIANLKGIDLSEFGPSQSELDLLLEANNVSLADLVRRYTQAVAN